jgi:hypothetical protein
MIDVGAALAAENKQRRLKPPYKNGRTNRSMNVSPMISRKAMGETPMLLILEALKYHRR